MTGLEALRVYYARHSRETLAVYEALTGRDPTEVPAPYHEIVDYVVNGTIEVFNDTTEKFIGLLRGHIPREDHAMIEEMCLHAFVDYIPPDSLFLAPLDIPEGLRVGGPPLLEPEDMAGGDENDSVE